MPFLEMKMSKPVIHRTKRSPTVLSGTELLMTAEMERYIHNVTTRYVDNLLTISRLALYFSSSLSSYGSIAITNL